MMDFSKLECKESKDDKDDDGPSDNLCSSCSCILTMGEDENLGMCFNCYDTAVADTFDEHAYIESLRNGESK